MKVVKLIERSIKGMCSACCNLYCCLPLVVLLTSYNTSAQNENNIFLFPSMASIAWIPAGLDYGFLTFSLHLSTVMNVVRDWIIVFTQSKIVPLCMGLRLQLKAFVFYSFCLSFLPHLSVYLICHSVLSAFHEHNPPGPELTQLSSPRGKNLCSPVHLKCVCLWTYLCIYSMLSFRI